MRLLLVLVLLHICVGICMAADRVTMTSSDLDAAIVGGNLAQLRIGGVTVVTPGDIRLTAIQRVGSDHLLPRTDTNEAAISPGEPLQRSYRDLEALPGSTLIHTYTLTGGDLVITQQATSPQAGVHGVRWGLGLVPFTCNILVPGQGGIRLTKDSPDSSYQFDYPMTWEAQFVIIEGPGRGVCVWAEDPDGRYKRLTIQRRPGGWQLGFTTHNNAPFAQQTQCSSVPWHISPYQGDWRAAAGHYRDWATHMWKLTPRSAQTPKWASDIRFVAIVGLETPVLEQLAKRVDPRQTLLYAPDWRKAGYDRMYPDYTANDTFAAFVRSAHDLGFRVMAHVNYFGCDPRSPEYATFKQYHVRNPWSHQPEWWLWDRADPPIRFAYISPASKAWRKLQIDRFTGLVQRYGVDALHLDQTLCIYNDDNGVIDGMTMLQGNIALHEALRAALPEVALSGEGLDEVTMRHEAFAQRHSYGLDFVEGAWDRSRLAMAHPVSAYVFSRFTQPYGYLGMCSPANGQLYAAWRENYKHWGVIPTFARPDLRALMNPTGFAAQCLEEAAAFTTHRLDPDLDGDWPTSIFYPYRGANVIRAAYRGSQGGTEFVVESGSDATRVTRTITGVAEAETAGSIDNWRCYNEQRIFGMDPETWYPLRDQPRDMGALHVSNLPSGFVASRVTVNEQLAVMEFRDSASRISLTSRLAQAVCGSEPYDGKAYQVDGPLSDLADGAQFIAQGTTIVAHPPWRAVRRNAQSGITETNGTGVAFAKLEVALPDVEGSMWFRSQVALASGAVGPGKGDGVLYRVTASAVGMPGAQVQVINATATPAALDMDLSPFRGRQVSLRLEVGPGPRHNAAFDWARWYDPRIEIQRRQRSTIGISASPLAYALSSSGEAGVRRNGSDLSVEMDLPGTLILLKELPRRVTLPVDLATMPLIVSFVGEDGQTLAQPQYASAAPGKNVAAGATRPGLSVHPPDHGSTIVDYPMSLPAGKVFLRAYVGLRDGSRSKGCGFAVRVNGVEIARRHKLPGDWTAIVADLSPWAGKPIVLSLVTDSEGDCGFDWGAWGEVGVTAK